MKLFWKISIFLGLSTELGQFKLKLIAFYVLLFNCFISEIVMTLTIFGCLKCAIIDYSVTGEPKLEKWMARAKLCDTLCDPVGSEHYLKIY